MIRRDDRADIPWPDHWDLPGGGREGDETPLACALRETREEVGLAIAAAKVTWRTSYLRAHGRIWFFAAHLPAAHAELVVLGDEGQEWRLMPPVDYIRHPRAVPHFAEQLGKYLGSPAFGLRDCV
ncbi:8-oxo-dGTP diphosphatase [Ruegeria marina]|uniref:8-oxo-dGTP diphosphatase n=1 Tax=Ruegeria marina TaxID=639004 RepID=A0A1G6N1U0_9RHOB|nr:8-oxo-dGTP diphosphatase [Ruegeria marina]